MRANHLLIIGAALLAGYMLGPQLSARVLPLLGSFRGVTMHLDPNEVSPNVEDRRGEHGGDMGAGPRWDQAGAPGRGGSVRCWDNVEHRDVPMEFCAAEDSRRRR